MPYYYLIIALQGFCIYHCYKNRNEQFWFYVIFFVPAVGSIIYLITQVFKKSDIESVQDGLAYVINPSKRVTDLQKKVDFANTLQNRVNLADAHFDQGNYPQASLEYEKAMNDYHAKDNSILEKLVIVSHFLNEEEKVLAIGKKIVADRSFSSDKAAFYFGRALSEKGDKDEAKKYLLSVVKRYSNYQERLDLASFYLEEKQDLDAKEILSEIVSESEHMNRQSYRENRGAIDRARKLLGSLS